MLFLLARNTFTYYDVTIPDSARPMQVDNATPGGTWSAKEKEWRATPQIGYQSEGATQWPRRHSFHFKKPRDPIRKFQPQPRAIYQSQSVRWWWNMGRRFCSGLCHFSPSWCRFLRSLLYSTSITHYNNLDGPLRFPDLARQWVKCTQSWNL